ncbi:MAG: ABC transporter ATP-binding protein [Pseudomonadota bacterium]
MNTMHAPLIEVRDLRAWYPVRGGVANRVISEVKAVNGVSFDVKHNEILGLAGESGSGKSTIGRSIIRLNPHTSGQIRFKGADLADFNSREIHDFRRKVQLIFQDPYASLDPRMNVEEIVTEPLIVLGFPLSKRQRRQKAAELLDMVSLSEAYLERRPSEMSGGQCQRVGIARALAAGPEFIVADEPVSALDVSIQAQITNLLGDLKERLGLSLLFISHDLALMQYLSDRVAVAYLGKIMEIGPSDQICSSPKHPYTEALLSAVPKFGEGHRAGKRIVLSGDAPNPISPPSGCVFRTRCPYAIGECAEIVPQLSERSPGHLSACIRTDVL